MSKNILFLATTNKLDSIDPSLRRPGRLEKEIEIPIPNVRAREEVISLIAAIVKLLYYPLKKTK